MKNWNQIPFDELKNQKIVFNQFERYPSTTNSNWVNYVIDSYKLNDENRNNVFVADDSSGIITEVVDSKWDYEHFGFKIGKIRNPIVINKCNGLVVNEVVNNLLKICKEQDMKLVIARVNGDNLRFIHELEKRGFKYYETIIWSILNTDTDKKRNKQSNISLFDITKDSVDQVCNIASNFQYQRGHFHCDKKLDKELVNSLYAKWIKSAIKDKKKLLILKNNQIIVGYFICDIDTTLSGYLGYNYGRLQSLALNSTYRGKGFGKQLFEGTICFLAKNGCRFIDSGYATKNHNSAKLHMNNGFYSVYEEVTMHLWL